ncbi:hypothetical protein, partial [Paenibacillus sp. 453mf]|uniref:hypothetical protein n=1 Tax=Paenibacillus sp. 453mf TaxID=1761874 RepID=UPI001BA53C93
ENIMFSLFCSIIHTVLRRVPNDLAKHFRRKCFSLVVQFSKINFAIIASFNFSGDFYNISYSSFFSQALF